MSIPTIYKGIEYRSRLEAKWAAFFDVIGWQATYEPFDGDGYIPDFLIHGDNPLLVEIKPAVTPHDYYLPIAKIHPALERHWEHDILILGASPLPRIENSWKADLPSAGVHGAHVRGEPTWQWSAALWHCCVECRTVNVFHDGRLMQRPSDCCDGQYVYRYLEGKNSGVHATRLLEVMWAAATNRVKWKGRAA